MKRMIGLFLAFPLALSMALTAAQGEIVFVDVTPAPMDSNGQSGDVSQAKPQAHSARADDTWPRTIVVTVGGDCTIGCTDAQRESDAGFNSVVMSNGFSWPFSGLSDFFQTDDLTLVNFEGTFTESENKVQKKFNFKAPAEFARILAYGSVEAVNLANNHSFDYGEEGFADTKVALDAEGIVYSAEGEPAIFETRGVKIGLVGNAFPYKDGRRDISKEVQAMRDQGCQIVIASFHWGSEGDYDFTRDQRNIGRAAIKSGADVVVGHHPHVIQGIEKYEERYILYSLANLVFGGNIDPDDRDTYIAQLCFTVYEDGKADPPQLKLIPARVTALADGTDYRPIIAEGETGEKILRKILGRSSNMKDFINPED